MRSPRIIITLKSLVPQSCFHILDILLALCVLAFICLDCLHRFLTISCVKPGDQLRNQVRVLCRLMYRWQHRTGNLALATAGRSVPIGKLLLAILLLFQVMLDLLLQEAQVQLTERIGTQAASIKSRIVAYQRHALQLLGDSVEADGIDTFIAQGLEQEERLEVCVGGDGHESAVSNVKRRLRWFVRGNMHV